MAISLVVVDNNLINKNFVVVGLIVVMVEMMVEVIQLIYKNIDDVVVDLML